jgi:4-hydroxy-tetrahydrodipicolinate reductase
MKIALIGYGKMGKAIDALAHIAKVDVVARIHPNASDPLYRSITKESVKDADVCIDFTEPNVVLPNLHALGKLKKQVVIGTTGWYHNLHEARKIVEEEDVGVIFGSNFSIGIALFSKILEHAASLINTVDEYDISLHEEHHRHKIDAPSGTALDLANILINAIERKTAIVTDNSLSKPNTIHVTATRCGAIPGTHSVIFDSPQDTITLTHTLRSRDTLAKGALKASEWIMNRKGIYNFNTIWS